jgi:hypothetical protein
MSSDSIILQAYFVIIAEVDVDVDDVCAIRANRANSSWRGVARVGH